MMFLELMWQESFCVTWNIAPSDPAAPAASLFFPRSRVWAASLCHDPGDLQVFCLSCSWKMGSFEISGNSIFLSLYICWVQILRCGTEVLLKVLTEQDDPPVLWIHFRCCQLCHYFSLFLSLYLQDVDWPQELHKWDWIWKKNNPRMKEQFLVK